MVGTVRVTSCVRRVQRSIAEGMVVDGVDGLWVEVEGWVVIGGINKVNTRKPWLTCVIENHVVGEKIGTTTSTCFNAFWLVVVDSRLGLA